MERTPPTPTTNSANKLWVENPDLNEIIIIGGKNDSYTEDGFASWDEKDDSFEDVPIGSASESQGPSSPGWLSSLFVARNSNRPETTEMTLSRAERRRNMQRNLAKAALIILPLLAIAAIILGLHYGGVVSADQIFNHHFTVGQGLGIFGGSGVASVVGLYLGFKGINYLLPEKKPEDPIALSD